MLLTSAYNPANIASHVWAADVTAWEASGTGYGRILVSDGATGLVKNAGSKSLSIVATETPQWTGATFSARYAALYFPTTFATNVSTSVLVALFDLGEEITLSNETYTLPTANDSVLIDINAGAGDTGYQAHLETIFYGFSDNPFPVTTTRTIDLLDNTYSPDYENHIDDASTFGAVVDSFISWSDGSNESGDYVYRLGQDAELLSNFTGTFRYILVRRQTGGKLGSCVDLGSDVTVTGEDLVLTASSGYLRFNTEVESA